MSSILEFFFSLEQNQILGTGVNVLILVIGVAAVIQLVMDLLRTRRDSAELDRFARQVAGRSDAHQIMAASRSLSQEHLAAKRVRVLHDLHAAGADIEPAALAGLALAELDRGARFARWASSTVVLLGLAGTLMGLSQAVLRAQPMLGEIVSGPAAIDAVIGTFSGLGTAFSTTLMGIVWAVLISICIGLLRGTQGAFLQRLEEVSLVHLTPYFRTSPALALVEAARKLTALEQHLGAALSEIVGQLRTQGLALTKIVEDSVGHLVADSRSTGEALRSSVEESLGHVVRETKERGMALTSTVDRSLAALIEEQHTGVVAILDRLDATQHALNALVGDPNADTRTLSQNLEVLQRGVGALHDAAERMLQITPAIEEAIARQVDRQSRDLHETMHSYVGELSKNVERQDAIIEDGMVKIGEGFPRFGELILDRLEEQGGILTGALGAPMQRIATSVQEQSRSIEHLESATAKLHEGAKLLQERGGQDQESARELRQTVADLGTHVRELALQLSRLEESVATIARPGPTTRPGPTLRPITTDRPWSDGDRQLDGVTGGVGATAAPGAVPAPTRPGLPKAPPRTPPSQSYWDRLFRRRK